MRRVERLETEKFEWDETKRQRIIREREIDFLEAAEALLRPHLDGPSDREGEARTLSICMIRDEVVAVVYTMRGDFCRIISARAARRNERREYRAAFGG